MPLIGFVSTRSPFTRRNSSGEELNDLAVGQIEIGRERRGVDLAQPKIRVPRVAFGARLEALREIHLIAVAVADVALHAFGMPPRTGSG